MATPVIIPARNEAATIGAIVRTFNHHPATHDLVYVGVDEATTDETAPEVWANGGCAYHTGKHGKGQNVLAVLQAIRGAGVKVDRIILCDGDYTGLTANHVTRITTKAVSGMVIGVPDWPDMDVPTHVTNSWPRVSGFRCIPADLVPEDAHGYLLETQINLAAVRAKIPVRYLNMTGLHSPFQWPLPERRRAALQADAKWGVEHGVF